jgi:hypothetical protein
MSPEQRSAVARELNRIRWAKVAAKAAVKAKAQGARKQSTQGGVIWLTSPNVSRS